MRYWSIVAPCTDGMGLTVAVTSYDGEICISPTACREIVPDPEFLTECIEQSYAELLAATGNSSKRRVAKKKAVRKPARKKAAAGKSMRKTASAKK
jgi:hypothetical protein